MTDRTREDLVEKAADAMFTANDGQLGQAYDDMARAALAVFEQAHTPTDDEREALARIVWRRFGRDPWPDSEPRRSQWLSVADTILAEGFRRPVSQKPSADKRECGFMGCGSPRCEAACSPEPQAETTDAEVERARIITDLREWARPLGDSPEEDTLRLVIARIESAAVAEQGENR